MEVATFGKILGNFSVVGVLSRRFGREERLVEGVWNVLNHWSSKLGV